MINNSAGDTDLTYLKLIIRSDIDKQMNHSAHVKRGDTVRDANSQHDLNSCVRRLKASPTHSGASCSVNWPVCSQH